MKRSRLQCKCGSSSWNITREEESLFLFSCPFCESIYLIKSIEGLSNLFETTDILKNLVMEDSKIKLTQSEGGTDEQKEKE